MDDEDDVCLQGYNADVDTDNDDDDDDDDDIIFDKSTTK